MRLPLLASISINKIFCELQVYFTKWKNSHFVSLNRFVETNVLAEMKIFLYGRCPWLSILRSEAISNTVKISFVHQIIWE